MNSVSANCVDSQQSLTQINSADLLKNLIILIELLSEKRDVEKLYQFFQLTSLLACPPLTKEYQKENCEESLFRNCYMTPLGKAAT